MTISCISCRTRVEYIDKPVYYVPDVVFPEFPLVGDYEIGEEGRKVTVDSGYFRSLLIFRTEYISALDEYFELKKLFSGGNENEL